jgi:DNA (cytosine-5)-methyltransferase 1
MASKIRIGLCVRRLMPVECERLQGFPDGWTAMVADSHRYRMLGNAVPVNMAHWLGIRIVAAEQRRKERSMMKKASR